MIVFASLLLQRVSPLFILMLLSRLFPCRLILFLVQSILLKRRSVLICRPLVFPALTRPYRGILPRTSYAYVSRHAVKPDVPVVMDFGYLTHAVVADDCTV